jgi:hypothetical protein
MANFFLNLLETLGRKRVILDRESSEPYLTRYYLFLKDRKKFPFNVFLHQFLKSDPDDLHDHPWPYATLIIKGGYWEWIPIFKQGAVEYDIYTGFNVTKDTNVIVGEQRVWRGPGHVRICKAKSYHRIEIEPGVDCWTIFMPGPQQRDWGFLTHRNRDWSTFKWVQHEEYIEVKAFDNYIASQEKKV